MTETKTRPVTPGSDVTWSVSADGFDTQSGTISDISESQSLDIYLLGSYGTFDKKVKDVQVNDSATWILLNDGTLLGCGDNSFGQQGSGKQGSSYYVTTFTQRLTDVAQIFTTGYTTWALKTDGTLWGCGYGGYGQQGNGTSSSYNYVTTFTQRLTDVAKVSISRVTTWALKTDGTLWGCGYNGNGQQGSGQSGSSYNVTTFTQRLTDVKEVFANYSTTWVLKTDGTLWGCGDNYYGQQGSGDTNNVTTFTQRLTDVDKVSTSTGRTTWALKTDGTLWSCGDNAYGQQGSGDTNNVTTFTQRLTDVAQVFALDETTWAIKTDNTLWGCGNNKYGNQGSGTSGDGTKVTTFTQRLTDVAQVSASGGTTWALKTDGTLWGCGVNESGQQSSGDKNDVTIFTQRFTDVAQVSVSSSTTWAIKTDGILWGCGNNNYGQQGNGKAGIYDYVTIFTKRNPSVTGYNSAKLTINPTPSDAVVTINSESVKTKDIRKGTSAEWSVSKAGYTTQTGTISHIYDDTILNITLEEE